MRRTREAIRRLGGAIEILGYGEDGGIIEAGELRIVFSWGGGWDHVSVSLADRCPTWDEMDRVKRAFFRENEWAVQYHVPASEHIDIHPYCLHLWRPQREKIPKPPGDMVGPRV